MLSFSSGPSTITVKHVVKANLLQSIIDDLMSNVRKYLKDNEGVVEYQSQPSGFVTLLFNPLLSVKGAIFEDYETTVKKCALATTYNKDVSNNSLLTQQQAFEVSDCLAVLTALNKRNEEEIATILKDITNAGIPAGEYDAWLQVTKNVMGWMMSPDILSCLSLALKYKQQKITQEQQSAPVNASIEELERITRNVNYAKLMADLFEFLFMTMYHLHLDASKSVQPKIGHKRVVPKEQYVEMMDKIALKFGGLDGQHKAFDNSDQRFANIASLLGDLLREMEKLNATLLPSAFTANAFILDFTEKLGQAQNEMKALDPVNKVVSKDKQYTPAPTKS